VITVRFNEAVIETWRSGIDDTPVTRA